MPTVNPMVRCPRCGTLHPLNQQASVYRCQKCGGMFDDDPNEGGDYHDDPSRRVEREEAIAKAAAKRRAIRSGEVVRRQRGTSA